LAHPVSGETIGEEAQRICPDAAVASRLDKEAAEDRAVSDAAAYRLSREAARRYYRCATTVSNVDVREYTMLSYVVAMSSSTRTPSEFTDAYANLDVVLNELLYSTHRSETRSFALKLRRDLRSEYREAYKVLFNEYPTNEPYLSAAPAAHTDPEARSNSPASPDAGATPTQ
jgi:hypothetical protein